VVRGIQLYEDYLSRNLVRGTPQLGQLYAVKGDLEYFVKSGNLGAALDDYRLAERYGYAPPEIQYRMGSIFYQLEDWGNSLDYLFKASADLPLNRRLLYALGNASYQRGDYFAAQGYYNRLLNILENQRIGLPILLPNNNPEFLDLGERMMMAYNNAGVTYEALSGQTGNRDYRSRAMALYAQSSLAWDAITRNPDTMIRSRLTENPGAPGINLGFLNANNAMYSSASNNPQIFPRIDKDVLEPSLWEQLMPIGGLQ
jgi:tetratricopeptide (TPR) repeat protein